ncbi:hypothetical protein FOB60_001039 [Candida parapsilosis]|uniref:Uncharacterized protein n=1 Tax=Candida parapsilosis TaxID=5480 RepID=A0A8X7NSA0_CANPA|nr:hypothetical protein FOB59_001034 [Candida parapsilosis]KAF6059457.1 hypothetical protein FOB60_001039 [Candida parapsilosis]
MNLNTMYTDLLESIVNKQLRDISSSPCEYQSALASVAKTSRLFNQLANARLYREIVVFDDDNESIVENDDRTYIHISQFNKFVDSLTIHNFIKIRSIQLHCKSNFSKYDYSALYEKFGAFWSFTKHNIEFINFDIDNIRRNQTILQFLAKDSYEIIEENDEVESRGGSKQSKIWNLTNWSILGAQELNSLPLWSPNLKTLDFFIETIIGDVQFPTQRVKMPNLEQLNLNTTLSTQCFLSLNPEVPNLQKVSISYSHSFNKPAINFNDYQMIDFDKLTHLELKLNCLHSDCSCVNEFYHQLSQNSHYFTKLRNLTIVNHNSKNHSSNLDQYAFLLSNQLGNLFSKFTSLEYIYIRVNEFVKSDRSKIDWVKFNKAISMLPHLRSLIIADFFNRWAPSIQLTRNMMVNTCNCQECHGVKSLFQQMAAYDEENHYTHNFDKFAFDSTQETSNHIDLVKKGNSKFMSHLVNHYKSQFHQSIIYSMSASYFREHDDEKLAPFKTLFKHGQLKHLAGSLKVHNPTLKVNLGGIVI